MYIYICVCIYIFLWNYYMKTSIFLLTPSQTPGVPTLLNPHHPAEMMRVEGCGRWYTPQPAPPPA